MFLFHDPVKINNSVFNIYEAPISDKAQCISVCRGLIGTRVEETKNPKIELSSTCSTQLWEYAISLTQQKAYIMWKEELTIPSKMTRSASLARYASSCDTLVRSITWNPLNKTRKKQVNELTS